MLPDTAVDRTGTDASQTLAGGDFNDTLSGLGGDDVLHGNGANDTLDGGAGNDTLIDGVGNDLIGGAGGDSRWRRRQRHARAMRCRRRRDGGLGASTASGGDAAGDTLSGIENLTGSAQADTLTGDGNANTLDGDGGDDTLIGGAGGDTLIGGGGSDTASYAASGAGVTVNLGAGTASGGDAAGDTLSGIENVIGSAQADTLTGDGGDNVLEAAPATTRSTAAPATTPRCSAAPARLCDRARHRRGRHQLHRQRPARRLARRHRHADRSSFKFSDVTVASAQFPANIDLSSLDGSTGFKLSGAAADDQSGCSVASAGDVNGDGFADLIVGASRCRPARRLFRRELRGVRQGVGLCRQHRPRRRSTAAPASSSAARRRPTRAASRWPRPATSTATASPT